VNPEVGLDRWELKVGGHVENPVTLRWTDFLALPQFKDVSDFHCVTTWSKYDNEWAGIPFKALFDALKVKPEARYAMLHSYGGYTTNVPLVDLLRDDVLFARTHNGEELTPEHGWPLRLVVPHLYFWKSAKWVRALEVRDADKPGFWERNGYHMYGDPFREQRHWGD